MFTRPTSVSSHGSATSSEMSQASSDRKSQRSQDSAHTADGQQQALSPLPIDAVAAPRSYFLNPIPLPRPPAGAAAAGGVAAAAMSESPGNAFEQSPPPYSFQGYPMSHGIIGLGITLPLGNSPGGSISPLDLSPMLEALSDSSSEGSPWQPLFTSQPLFMAPSLFTFQPLQLPQVDVADAPPFYPAQACDGQPGQDQPHGSSSASARPDLLGSRMAAEQLHPAAATLAMPGTFPFTFVCARDGSMGQAQARVESTGAQLMGWHNTATAQGAFTFNESQNLNPHPSVQHTFMVQQPAASAQLQVPAEAQEWFHHTHLRLTQAGFTEAHRRAIAQHVNEEARALLMWHLDALKESGYRISDLMFMIMQPGSELWLPSLARVARTLYGQGLTGIEVANILRSPHASDMLRSFEPGPSRH